MTGYVVALVIILVLCLQKKMRLPFTRTCLRDVGKLVEATSVGLSSASNQVGYCIKISFSNALAFSLAGMAATKVFSVCMQAVSIASIFIAGVVQAVIPILSSLYGQRDFSGVKILMKTAVLVQFVANLFLILLFEFWPQGLIAMYNVTGEIVPLVITGLRIFSIMFLFRGFTCVYMFYFPVINRKRYAFTISLVDGCLGIIPLALILTKINGVNGLWQAYALLSALLLTSILAINYVISMRSYKKFSWLLLLEHEDENIPVYECSLKMKPEAISQLAENIQHFCLNAGVDEKLSALTAISVEEMSVYSVTQSNATQINDMDILLKIYPENIMIDFRSIGKPFDTSTATEEYSNVAILRKIVSDIKYTYVLGMNQTRLICSSKNS
ncbi:MAG: hypothetical protein IJS09_11240 [Treponema sp.]|nr:hypothetical protein [Treponema sp.]